MTDWRTMEAGRELDKLIAEKLGQEVEVSRYIDDQGCGDEEFIFYNVVDERTERGWKKHTLPSYSTDLNAALTLLQSTRLECEINIYPDGNFRVAIYDDSRGPGYGLPAVSASDLPLAVCRAFLSWKEKQ